MLSTLVHPQPVLDMGRTAISRVHPRVGIFIDTATSAGQEIVKGVLSYVRAHTTWRVNVPDRRRPDDQLKDFAGKGGDGILAQIDDYEMAERIADCQVLAVNICGEHHAPDIPLIATDDLAVAQMAMDHVVHLGFKNLRVCGWADRRSSIAHIRAFVDEAEAIGIETMAFELPQRAQWEKSRDEIAAWLKTIPKPVAISASDDALGQQILDACHVLGLAVPKDVAVLGVGNDELICGVADPPMSSIVLDNASIGFEAARRLHQMLERDSIATRDLLIPPIDVASRPSTDAVPVDDSEVASAAHFIRAHALEGIKVADVLAAVPVSRRVLETRFRHHFGRTLHQEIQGIQLGHIKKLLRETDLSMFQIASKSGFRHVEYMSVVFKREVGMTPTDYRRNWQERR